MPPCGASFWPADTCKPSTLDLRAGTALRDGYNSALLRAILTSVFLVLVCAPRLRAQDIVISDSGRTVRIPRIQTKLTLDGKLDEPVWSQLTPITDFTQTNPDLGAPA